MRPGGRQNSWPSEVGSGIQPKLLDLQPDLQGLRESLDSLWASQPSMRPVNTVPPLPHHSAITAWGPLEDPKGEKFLLCPLQPQLIPPLSSDCMVSATLYGLTCHQFFLLSSSFCSVFCNRIAAASMSVFCPHKLAQLGTHANVWYPNTSVRVSVPLPSEWVHKSLGRDGEYGIT